MRRDANVIDDLWLPNSSLNVPWRWSTTSIKTLPTRCIL